MRNVLIIFAALTIVFVGGYFLLNSPNTPEQANENEPGDVAGEETSTYPLAVERTREKLSAELSIPLGGVTVLSYKEAEWPVPVLE